jgi:hypothetical protein
MRVICLIILFLSLPSSAQMGEMASLIKGLKHPREIASEFNSPVSYLETWIVTDVKSKLTPIQCHSLSRHILDVHYLSLAINHQGYPLSNDLPVFKLLANNHAKFKDLYGEQNQIILTSNLPNFFTSEGMYCGNISK